MIIRTRAASVVGCGLKQVLIIRPTALAAPVLALQVVPSKKKKPQARFHLSFDMTSEVLVALSSLSSENTV